MTPGEHNKCEDGERQPYAHLPELGDDESNGVFLIIHGLTPITDRSNEYE